MGDQAEEEDSLDAHETGATQIEVKDEPESDLEEGVASSKVKKEKVHGNLSDEEKDISGRSAGREEHEEKDDDEDGEDDRH